LVRHFGAHLKALGIDPRPLARRLGMSPVPSDRRGDVWLRVEQVRAFGDLAAAEAGDADFGLSAAASRARGSFGGCDFAIQYSPDLRTALQFIGHGAARMEAGADIRFEQDSREGRLVFASPGYPEGLGRHGQEFRTAVFLRSLRAAAGDSWGPSRAWFAHPEPENAAGVAAAMGTSELEFSRPDSGFAVPRASLDVPLPHGDRALFMYLERAVEEEGLQMPVAVSPLLKDALRELVARRSFDAGALARAMHMSRRTLQRRLAEAGTTFHELLDEVRFDEARGLLAEGAASSDAVARQLGYANHRAFDRAFHRWTGTAPSTWRHSELRNAESRQVAGSQTRQ
jgi:AraC-like DNA-binding protein